MARAPYVKVKKGALANPRAKKIRTPLEKVHQMSRGVMRGHHRER